MVKNTSFYNIFKLFLLFLQDIKMFWYLIPYVIQIPVLKGHSNQKNIIKNFI
jgi:hypothetical protein